MSDVQPAVVFIGPMGAGKTRLGKRVARLLGVGFTDTDKVVVAENGPIAALFEEYGEPHFRALERKAVHDALKTEFVVSLGGGAVLHPDTQAELAGLPVVYLSVSAEAVAPRLQMEKRPLVSDDGIVSWQRIYDERRPLYERLASWQLDTSSFHSLDDAAEEVVAWLQSRQ